MNPIHFIITIVDTDDNIYFSYSFYYKSVVFLCLILMFRQQRYEGLSKTFIMLKLHTLNNSKIYLL